MMLCEILICISRGSWTTSAFLPRMRSSDYLQVPLEAGTEWWPLQMAADWYEATSARIAHFIIKNYLRNSILWYEHLCMRGGDEVIEEPLWPGTSKATEGYLAGMLFGKAKEEGCKIELNWQDTDSSSYTEIIPKWLLWSVAVMERNIPLVVDALLKASYGIHASITSWHICRQARIQQNMQAKWENWESTMLVACTHGRMVPAPYTLEVLAPVENAVKSWSVTETTTRSSTCSATVGTCRPTSWSVSQEQARRVVWYTTNSAKDTPVYLNRYLVYFQDSVPIIRHCTGYRTWP